MFAKWGCGFRTARRDDVPTALRQNPAAKDHSRLAREALMQLWTKPAGKNKGQRSRSRDQRPRKRYVATLNSSLRQPSISKPPPRAPRRALLRGQQQVVRDHGLLPLPTANMPRPRDRRIRVDAGAATARRHATTSRRRRAADVRNNKNRRGPHRRHAPEPRRPGDVGRCGTLPLQPVRGSGHHTAASSVGRLTDGHRMARREKESAEIAGGLRFDRRRLAHPQVHDAAGSVAREQPRAGLQMLRGHALLAPVYR